MITTIQQIVEAMCRFQSPIEYSCHEAVTIEKCFALEPRLMYYVSSSTNSGTSSGCLTLKYKNTEVPMDCVFRADTTKDFLHHMFRCVTNIRRNLVVAFRWGAIGDPSDVRQEFRERYSNYLPHYTNIECSTVKWGDCPYKLCNMTVNYRIGRVKLAMMEQEVNREVEHLCHTLFWPGMPVEAKILLAHNYLATHVLYVKDRSDPLEHIYTQSAYGALINKHCVCQGYAEAFNQLMNHERIECRSVGGVTVPTPDYDVYKETHAWNVVNVGGDSYAHMDVTWDKDENQARMTWFALTDVQMREKGRQWTKTGVPPCHADGAAMLRRARDYVRANRARLLANGVDDRTLAGI